MPTNFEESASAGDETRGLPTGPLSTARTALDDLFIRRYKEIRILAARVLWNGSNPTLGPTALANEAYLKLSKDPPDLAGKTYEETISILANAMRQILIDASRRRQSLKRDPAAVPEKTAPRVEDELIDWLIFEALLKDLERENPRQAQIVDCRFCLAMTVEETAAALNISKATVEREWREARTKLGSKIEPGAR